MDVASEYRTMFYLLLVLLKELMSCMCLFFLLELMYHGGEMDTKLGGQM